MGKFKKITRAGYEEGKKDHLTKWKVVYRTCDKKRIKDWQPS